MSRNKLLQTAAAEVGTTETPPGSNRTKYGKWYGAGLDGHKWCAMFVSWVFDQAGIPLGPVQSRNGIHHCQSAHNYYKSKGMLTSNPQPGDIVLYDWEGDGYADHIGIFIKWKDAEKKVLEAYEGNTAVGNDSDGGRVMRRSRTRNTVKSFVNPGVFTDTAVETPDTDISIGSRGSDVTVIQHYLYELGYQIEVDGWYGQQTAGFVKDFQRENLMPVNGITDVVTKGALQEAAADRKIARNRLVSGSYLKKGNSGFLVTEIQRILNKRVPDAKLQVNGVFDEPTYKAVKAFQKQNGLQPDGIVGPRTFAKLGIQ